LATNTQHPISSFALFLLQNAILKVTHSQLLEGFKCESQIGNNRKRRNQGTLPGLQHFEGVEGRAGAPGWD